MTLTPSVRAISLCSFPCVANSSACANFVAISTLECFLLLGIAACPIRPPPYVVPQNLFLRVRCYTTRSQPKSMVTSYRAADLTRGMAAALWYALLECETCVGESRDV